MYTRWPLIRGTLGAVFFCRVKARKNEAAEVIRRAVDKGTAIRHAEIDFAREIPGLEDG